MPGRRGWGDRLGLAPRGRIDFSGYAVKKSSEDDCRTACGARFGPQLVHSRPPREFTHINIKSAEPLVWFFFRVRFSTDFFQTVAGDFESPATRWAACMETTSQ